MSVEKKYWQDLIDRDGVTELAQGRDNEFVEKIPVEEVLADKKFQDTSASRRDFLKFLGFSVTAATLAACETPVIKSIPYVNKPEDITPGIANWYASTYYDGSDYASILVKTREGRPIFIKGNSMFGVNGGAINARINSSVLSLYDSERAKGPTKSGKGISWAEADKEISTELKSIASSGGRIAVLSNTIVSPSTWEAIAGFKNAFGSAASEDGSENADEQVSHVQYDSISYSGLTVANEKCFGKRAVPSYHFDKADVVVSVAADFLGTWLNTPEFTSAYAMRRKPENGKMSRHFQFESRMSIAGSNADVRHQIKPSEESKVLISLYDHIAKKTGGAVIGGSDMDEMTSGAANELLAAKGKSLVIAGSNSEHAQVLVNGINEMLGNYGKTVDLKSYTRYSRGDDKAMAELIADMAAGKVDALIVYGTNPVYTLPDPDGFKSALEKVKTSISFSLHLDETASLCTFHLPDHHALESWNDYQPRVGHYAIAQPTISPLYDTRQAQDSFLNWGGNQKDWHSYMKGLWVENGYGGDKWNKAVHNGSVEVDMPALEEDLTVFAGNITDAASALKKVSGGAWELFLYQKEGIGDGSHAGNPWLQELPDPISKVTWDNYITMAPSDMKEKGFQTYIGQESPASMAKVSMGDQTVELPVYPSPGQKAGTLGVALGYGRGANGEKVGMAACTPNDDGARVPVGVNVYPFASMIDDSICYAAMDVSIEGTGATYALGITQTHMTDMGRDSVVKETDITTFNKGDKNAYNAPHELTVHHDVNDDGEVNALDKVPVSKMDLWSKFPVEAAGHRWGMTIDLSSCIGCAACLTACQAENNVPVVGKDEVRRSREMHWLRLDRYYSSAATRDDGYTAMEVPEENPEVSYVPVMCQHCNHAPCETVCPVAATTHSNEGLNQMTYNRCIGTRYCANNCPYKVRRFNWWNYNSTRFDAVNPANDDIGRMVLNPDVTVRGRGVMEKCSLCVQSIQAGKLQAKKDGRPVKDGEIQTACSSGCPTNAITFGDLNDKNTAVAVNAANDRTYKMIEEVGTQPNVHYMVKVRNNTNA